MKEKRKGMLQRGIMVAVSALTIVAGAGTVLAYEAMPSSDKSFEDTLDSAVDHINFYTGTIDPLQIDFSQSDSVFVYLDGTQVVVNNNFSTHALCTHSMINGYYSTHSPNSSGGCTVKIYTAQRCKKCGYLANAKYYNTVTYAKCPHK